MSVEITVLDGCIYTKNPFTQKLHRHKRFISTEAAEAYLSTTAGHQTILDKHRKLVRTGNALIRMVNAHGASLPLADE